MEQKAKVYSLQQNQSIAWFKLAAAIFVVFIHARFPGTVGTAVQALARWSVGGFFAISGFFSLGITGAKLKKRMKSILKLLLAGIAIELVCGCFCVEFLGAYPEEFQGSTVAFVRGLIPSLQEWMAWLLVDSVSIKVHLWYLSGIFTCYGILWVYTVFFGEEKVNYQPLYILSACLLCLYLVLGPMSTVIGLTYHVELVRNGLVLGLPMFSLGLFLRQYWQVIWKNYGLTAGKLWGAICAGAVLTLLECFGNSAECDLFLGSLLIIPSVVLLGAKYPVLSQKRWADPLAKLCSGLSTGIYLLHFSVIDVWLLLTDQQGSAWMSWLYPVMVVLLTALLSGIWLALMALCRKKR